jgi:hypothetical protein
MKHSLHLKFSLSVLFVFAVMQIGLAQPVAPPQGINYQAVARDNSGTILANSPISIRVAILSDTITPVIQYEEEHLNLQTNQF